MAVGAIGAIGVAILLQAASQQPGPCRLSGTVVDQASRAGVAGVDVVARHDDTVAASTTTSADGGFELLNLARGSYLLAASAPGFAEISPLRVELAGAPCDAIVEVAYRLKMQVESRGAAPRLPDATTITNAAAPVLTGAAIAAAPGALEDVFRAFQSQPGVAASQDNRNDLLVRGGGAIENQTRIDGFDVPNPNHFGAQGGTGGGLSMIPPWLIDVGTIEAGGFSASFGERMSSVADISLRPAKAGRLHGMLGFGVGGAMGEIERPFGDGKGSWVVSVRRSLLELTFHEEGGQVVPKYADALVRVERRVGGRHSVRFLGIGASDSVQIEDYDGGTDRIDGTERVGLAGVRLDSTWSPKTASTVVASIGTSEIDAKSRNGAIVDGLDRGRDVDIRFRADLRRQTRIGSVLAGLAVKAFTFDYELLAYGVWTPYSPIRENISAKSRQSFADVAGYVETTKPLFGRGRVSAGLRVDRWGASGITTGSPRLKGDYLLGNRARLVGYWGEYRQAVPYIWMASAPQNVSLVPIASTQGGGGVDLEMHRGVHLGIEGFDKHYRNYPVDRLAPGHVLVDAVADFESPFVGQLTSGGRVRARGVDTVVSASPGEHLKVVANYSYWRVSQMGFDNVWRRAQHELRHQARLELNYTRPANWAASLRWRYVSGHPYTPFSPTASIKAGRAVFDLTRINTLEYAPYHRLDVRVDKTLTRGRASAIVYFEVDNLYDRDNLLIYQWDRRLRRPKPTYQWGRTYVGGLRVEF
ncbi:MAG: TonB-dependent receptor [Acidobacteria bacterium]|nr:TonB-dependent receptor [Acidobacteriota bacterium]